MTPAADPLRDGSSLERCPVCGAAGAGPLFTTDGVPLLSNVQYPTASEARGAPTGSIQLTRCPSCGLLWNAAYEPHRVAYSPAYENSLHFSPRFQRYATEVAAELVARHALTGATVVEIGSGKGDFLRLLCDAGAARGIGYDPSYAGDTPARPDLRFVASLFPEDGLVDADFVCARHVFEHLHEPGRLLGAIRAALPEGRSVGFYVEVPDGDHLLRQTALWDVIYEHPLHFTARSMSRLFADVGLHVSRMTRSFGGQYLAVEASTDATAHTRPPDAGDDAALAEAFQRRAADLRDRWASRLATLLDAGPVALWGAGSKGVSFLASVPGAARLAAVVDINPRKQDRHVPVTGQLIVAPDALAELGVCAVVLLNPVYRDEVAAMLSVCRVEAEIVTDPAA